MPVKQFYIYAESYHPGDDNNQLVIEVGNNHIACAVKTEGQEGVAAVELFSYSKVESVDFDSVLTDVKISSKLLQQAYAVTNLYINNELAVLVPSFKFNKEISEEYLRIVFGDNGSYTKSIDAIEVDPVIMNVYRVQNKWMEALNQNFTIASVKHTYSNIITEAMHQQITSEAISIRFYNSHIIVCALHQGIPALVQSFEYESQDDVLYFLLNLVNQLNFTSADLTLYISGMVDLQSGLYNQLQKYFENIKTEDGYHNGLDSTEHPGHYFTPFTKLAV